MKHISEYLNIKSGIQLNEFLVKKHIQNNTENKIQIPVLKLKTSHGKYNDEYHFEKWRDVKLNGDGKFIIYDDLYHNSKHIAYINDMEACIGLFYADYEDFDESNIHGVYKTLKEAVIGMFEDNGLSKSDINIIKHAQDFEDIPYNITRKMCKNYYDHNYWAWEVMQGRETGEDIINDDDNLIDALTNWADIDNMDEMIKTYKK